MIVNSSLALVTSALSLPRQRRGFTLLEMLTVLAILGILAAFVVPSVSSARRSANKAKARVQFTQWAAAIESFRSEYGYYPAFDASNLVNGGATTSDHLFYDILVAKKRDGTALTAGGAAALQNRKLISFYAFSDADFTPGYLIRDPFDNTAIAVLVDKDLDGVIVSGTDFATLPLVGGIAPTNVDFPASGVRAGVIFYAPPPGATAANPEFIFSWK